MCMKNEVMAVVNEGGGYGGGRLIHCGYVRKKVFARRGIEEVNLILVEVVAMLLLSFFETTAGSLPTPQGPFWSYKTYACSKME